MPTYRTGLSVTGESQHLQPSANRVSSSLLFAAAALAPLPFGSNNFSTIAFWCIVLGIAVAFASPLGLRRQQRLILGGVAILAAVYFIVLHEQLSEHPWLASPHPLWRQTSDALGEPIPPLAAIARNQPFYAIGASLAATLALVGSLVVCSNRTYARYLLQVLAWSGLGYAVYGVAAHLIDPTLILWQRKPAYFNVLTSTFVNPNTAATYFGSCAIVWLALLVHGIRMYFPLGAINWKAVARWLLAEPPRRIAVSFVGFFVCLTAMFMTGSRAGVTISLSMLVLTFVLYFYRDLPRKGGVLVLVAIGAAVALILLQIMGSGVGGRFELQGLVDEGRLATYRSTLRMIGDRAWLGSGLGTFAIEFPAYRSNDVSMRGIWDLAHSTPLELAAELGIPLTALVVLSWLVILGILFYGARVRRRDVIVPISALAVALLALLHSCVDFSLQIPGYAIIVFLLVGAGLAQSFSSTSH